MPAPRIAERLKARIRSTLADPELAEYAFIVALIALVWFVTTYVH
jgi:hypothetical protein